MATNDQRAPHPSSRQLAAKQFSSDYFKQQKFLKHKKLYLVAMPNYPTILLFANILSYFVVFDTIWYHETV